MTAGQRSVSCRRRDWCVLKAGHGGDCSESASREPNVTWVMGTRKALARSIAIALNAAMDDVANPAPGMKDSPRDVVAETYARAGKGLASWDFGLEVVKTERENVAKRGKPWTRLTANEKDALNKRALDIVDTMIEVKAMGAFQHPWREPRRGTDDDDDG